MAGMPMFTIGPLAVRVLQGTWHKGALNPDLQLLAPSRGSWGFFFIAEKSRNKALGYFLQYASWIEPLPKIFSAALKPGHCVFGF